MGMRIREARRSYDNRRNVNRCLGTKRLKGRRIGDRYSSIEVPSPKAVSQDAEDECSGTVPKKGRCVAESALPATECLPAFHPVPCARPGGEDKTLSRSHLVLPSPTVSTTRQRRSGPA